MRIKASEIARGLRLEGIRGRGFRSSRTWGDLQEALDCGSRGEVGGIQPEAFSLRDLAANTIYSRNGDPVGHAFIEDYFNPRYQDVMQEAMAAVDSSAFAGITGQLLINKLLASFTAEDFVVSKIIPTVPTQLNGERIPGVALPQDPGEDFTVANEMDELHYLGFSEEYVETPATTKRQLGIAVTKELIFFDRTGLVLQRAAMVGTLLGLRKEKNLLGTLIGQQTFTEKRTGDSAAQNLATYYAAVDAGRWINHIDNNPLTDWTNINKTEQQFAQVLDPNTGEPIMLPGRRVLIAPQLQALTLNQLLGAQQVWKASNGGFTPGAGTAGTVIAGRNPLMDLDIEMHTSRQLLQQIQLQLLGGLSTTNAADAAGYWWYGDPAAFAYMENWPITVVQAPTNSEAEFTQDIVVRFKASERGTPAVIEPRRMMRNRGVPPAPTAGSSGDDASSSSSGATLPVIV